MADLSGLTKNFFPTPQEGFTATIAQPVTAGAGTVYLDKVTGYNNGDVATLAVDPANSKKQVFTGVVDTAAVRLTSVVWTEGSNVNHSVGATVVDYVTATDGAQISKGIKQAIDQTGNLTVHYNVKSYGAVGDGVTDDTTAIQAAITAASTAGGGVVYFPRGTYLVSAALNLKSYVSLKGVGGAWATSKGSIIKTTSTTVNVLYYTNAGSGLVSAHIEDLRIEGPASGTGRGIYLANGGGSSNPHVNIAIKNVKISGFGTGLEAQCIIVSVIENVTAETCTTGFYLNGGAAFANPNTSTTMTACYANGCSTTGFNIRSTAYSTFNGLAADDCGTAYLIDTCNNLSFNSPGAEWANPTTASPADGFKVTGSHQINFISPYTFQNKHYSFWVTGTSLNIAFIGPSENTPVAATNSFKSDAGSFTTLIDIDFTTGRSDVGSTFYINDGSSGVVVPTGGYLYSNGPVTSAGLFTMFGGMLIHKNAVTTTYAVLTTDNFITCDATGGAFTATLPTAVGREGQVYTLKKIDASANAVTIATTSAQTIDGVTTQALSTRYESITVVSDNANWHII